MKKIGVYIIVGVIILGIFGVRLYGQSKRVDEIRKGSWELETMVNNQGEIEYTGDKASLPQIENRNISLKFQDKEQFEIIDDDSKVLWQGKYKIENTRGSTTAIIFTLEDKTQEIGAYGKVISSDGNSKETIVVNMPGYGISFIRK